MKSPGLSLVTTLVVDLVKSSAVLLVMVMVVL